MTDLVEHPPTAHPPPAREDPPGPREAAGPGQAAALAAALVTVVLWATAFVGIRAAAPDLGAGPLALGRLLVAAVVLGLVVLVRREGLPPRRTLGGLVICGVLWFAAYNVLLNAAERQVDAGTAAMLVNIGPVLIALIAGVVLQEGFPRNLVIGCGIAFAGALVIGLATADLGRAAGGGAALCVLAALAYAGGVVAQKPLLAEATALQVTWTACTIGAIACLPWLPSLIGDVRDAPASAVAWMIYLGVLPTAVAFTTWAYALSRTTAGRMGATTYLVPPLAILLGWALLHETPPAIAVLGGALCLAGVVVTRREGRER